MAATTTSSIGMTMDEHRVVKFLTNTFPRLLHGRWGVYEPLPLGKGNTVRWPKMAELSVGATETTALTEDAWATAGYNAGSLPASVSAAITEVTASPSNYGAYVEGTDDLEEQSDHDIGAAYATRLGRQAGKVIDQLTRTVLTTNFTNITRPGSAAADSDITSADVMDWKLLTRAKGTLEGRDVDPVDGMQYVLLTSPYTITDMLNDERIHNAFQAAATADGKNLFQTGFFGRLLDIDIYRTSNAYSVAAAGSGGITVYYSILFGYEAYGVTGISGREPDRMGLDSGGVEQVNMSGDKGNSISPVKIIVKPLGWRDPYNEVSAMAWKVSHVAKVLDAAKAQVIRHAVTAS